MKHLLNKLQLRTRFDHCVADQLAILESVGSSADLAVHNYCKARWEKVLDEVGVDFEQAFIIADALYCASTYSLEEVDKLFGFVIAETVSTQLRAGYMFIVAASKKTMRDISSMIEESARLFEKVNMHQASADVRKWLDATKV